MPANPFAPDLDDASLFECRPGVPILDVHTRGERTVDRDRLDLIVQNSNARADRGDPGLMFIGHTTDGIPEKDQPPLAGYLRNYQLGEHGGKPCILADLLYDKSKPQAFEFPRRSVEVYYSDLDPRSNYIDALALLKTSPERDLGLVAYNATRRLERYSLDRSEADPLPEPTPQPLPETPTVADTAAAPTPDMLATLTTALASLQAMVAALQPATPHADESDPETPAADEPAAAADTPAVSDAEKADMSKNQANVVLARYERVQKGLTTKIVEQGEQIKTLERNGRKAERKADLTQLVAEGYALDIASELEEVIDLAPERYTKKLASIRQNYKQSLDGQPMIEVAGDNPNDPGQKKKDDKFGQADAAAIVRYMRDHKIDNYDTAMQRYLADRREGKILVRGS